MSGQPRPNLLVIVIDCLRADRAEAIAREAGSFLGRLTREGTCFTETIAAASLTPPSFASILTAKDPFAHGVRTLSSRLADDLPTLPVILRAAGYHTAARFTGPLVLDTGLGRGFDDARWRPVDRYLDTSWGRELCASLARFPEPWFLLLHLWELHWPRRIPLRMQRERFGRTRYDRAVHALDEQLAALDGAVPPRTVLALTGDHGERVDTPYDEVGHVRLAATEVARTGWDLMWRALRPFVRVAARRRGALRGLMGFGDVLHGADLRDELLRVPWIMRGPGVQAGLRVYGQVRHIDIAPTLLEILGLPVPDGYGSSLAHEMGTGRVDHRPAYSEAAGPPLEDRSRWLASLRSQGIKVIRRPYAPGSAPVIYDLSADPTERRDVASEEPELSRRAERALAEMMAGGEAVDFRIRGDEEVVARRLAELGYLEDR